MALIYHILHTGFYFHLFTSSTHTWTEKIMRFRSRKHQTKSSNSLYIRIQRSSPLSHTHCLFNCPQCSWLLMRMALFLILAKSLFIYFLVQSSLKTLLCLERTLYNDYLFAFWATVDWERQFVHTRHNSLVVAERGPWQRFLISCPHPILLSDRPRLESPPPIPGKVILRSSLSLTIFLWFISKHSRNFAK